MIWISRRSGRSSRAPSACDLRAAEANRAGVAVDHPDHGLRGRGLPASGLPDERHHLPHTDRERHAVDRLHGQLRPAFERAVQPSRDRVAGEEPLDLEQLRRPCLGCTCRPGSRRSLGHGRVVEMAERRDDRGESRARADGLLRTARTPSRSAVGTGSRRAPGRAAAARPGSRSRRRRPAGRAWRRTASACRDAEDRGRSSTLRPSPRSRPRTSQPPGRRPARRPGGRA